MSYEHFSEVYDIFMEDIPYVEWTENLEKIWTKFGQKPNLILDLACGTGNITEILAQKGYEMIGVDSSLQMLSKAKEKADESKLDILYLNQDMREFELYGTVDSVICLCDSINYILDEDELLQVFRLVNNYLNPEGLFIFDINTIYKFEKILGDSTFCQTTDDLAFTCENFFDSEEMIHEYYTNFFIEDEDTKMYQRFDEFHYEKAYTIEKISELIEKSGLGLVAVYDENLFKKPNEESQRIYFIAKEVNK